MVTLEILISLTFCLEKFWNDQLSKLGNDLQGLEIRQRNVTRKEALSSFVRRSLLGFSPSFCEIFLMKIDEVAKAFG